MNEPDEVGVTVADLTPEAVPETREERLERIRQEVNEEYRWRERERE